MWKKRLEFIKMEGFKVSREKYLYISSSLVKKKWLCLPTLTSA